MADIYPAATPWPPSIMRRAGHSRGCYFLDGLDTKGPPGGVPLAKENPAELGGPGGVQKPSAVGDGEMSEGQREWVANCAQYQPCKQYAFTASASCDRRHKVPTRVPDVSPTSIASPAVEDNAEGIKVNVGIHPSSILVQDLISHCACLAQGNVRTSINDPCRHVAFVPAAVIRSLRR